MKTNLLALLSCLSILCSLVQSSAGQDSITTQVPVVLSDIADTICVYSVIDIPFMSTGVFVNNSYIAQLSDSNGNFTYPINVLGTLVSDQTYPGPSGIVSGKIVTLQQPVPPGCNYLIRVVSTNPATTGSVYGPFCIRDCDMETNNTQDIQVCLPPGVDTCIPVHINTFNPAITYAPGNRFEVEVLSTTDFSLLNTGGLGIVISDKDTCLHLNIADTSYLSSLGLGVGTYYIRIVADSSSEPWNELGTLIDLTIGAPNPTPLTILDLDQNYNHDTSVCVGSTMFFEVSPFNNQSTYQWTLNNNNNWPGNDGTTGIIFNGAGTFYLSAIETNYGCIGPSSDTVVINVLGPPSLSITGPQQVCIGDTLNYSVSLENQTHYSWSSPTGTILDTANNNLTITFSTPGTQQIFIHAVGFCGVADGQKNVAVKAYPIVDAGDDTTICKNDTVNLSTPSGTYTYLWSTGASTRNITVTPDSTTTYTITVTVPGLAGCKSDTTVTVFVDTSCSLPVISLEFDNIVSVTPNPATNQLTIHASSFHNEAVTVSIMNVLGQETSAPTSLTPALSKGEGAATIDISRLAAGVYFVELKTESGKVVQKFVKAANTY